MVEMVVGSTSSASNMHEVGNKNSNPYRNMVMDAIRMSEGNVSECPIIEEKPNADAARFFYLLKDSDEPLWDGYVFHTEEYRHGRKTYNSGVCIKGSTSSEFEVDYYSRLEEVIELQYHSKQNRVFLFKCYWYDTTDRGIRVDPHYGLVEINSEARHRNVNDVFVFAKQ
jgi:hypothetical protein